MGDLKQTETLLFKLFNDQKNHIFKFIENSQCGMKKALFLIYLNDGPLYAADISYSLEISMARTTVLLQKLEKKNLIIKELDERDKRKSHIKLTEEGCKEVETQLSEIYKLVSFLNKNIGFEKLYTFIDILKEINHKIEEYGEV